MTLHTIPLQCNRIDHYTIIVPDAKEVSDFHHQILGYDFLQLKEVNAGSVPQGQFDMLNYIHEWPDQSGRLMVITEGLTDASIFRRYMSKYGQGIHHVALQVDDLDVAFATLQAHGVKTTSDIVLIDFLSGLKQVFVDNAETGAFIELIERSKNEAKTVDATEKNFFAHDNMAGLASTMSEYIQDVLQVEQKKSYQANGPTQKKIAAVKLHEFVLEVDTPENSASFFERYFGFVRAEDAPENTIRIYLPSEPELTFLCMPKSGQNKIHQLVCRADLPGDYQKDYAANSTQIQFSDNQLHFKAAATGYPMRIIFNP